MTKPSPPSPPMLIMPRTSRATIHKRGAGGAPLLVWPRALSESACNERLEVAVLLVAHSHSSREFRTRN